MSFGKLYLDELSTKIEHIVAVRPFVSIMKIIPDDRGRFF